MITRNKAFLMATAAILAGALAPQAAFAEGTLAGTTLSNTASVSYNVSAVAQTAIVASQSVTVDRKINFTISAPGGSFTKAVVQGQTGAAVRFSVSNLSNAPLDLSVAAVQFASGISIGAISGDSDTFDMTSTGIYADTDGNNIFDIGADLPITYLDEILPDTQRTLFFVGSTPLDATNDGEARFLLTLTAHDGDGAGTLGAQAVATTGANTAGVDTVFADPAADNDSARDGIQTIWGDFVVRGVAMTTRRYSKVVSNPLEGTNNPRGIPGATIEYCIVAKTDSANKTANNVKLVDILPANMTFDTSFDPLVGGTPVTGACNGDGTPVSAATAYNPATREITLTIPEIPVSQDRTFIYRAKID